ncbi:MAG TPA: methylenetetrahydrofolate--tRNA-(uracil(54)-C(5))-methyltransferase (FADH(2)-oxidizing) TrmFO [Terriglobales bacterium]|nr:methylenetetrahydrofolate--tRNA-(uracil(54)-C(5))-methyltransferase (FADH(2)-oxidizing) TrmFO [Terriglobales bacterium]
MVVRVIGGGLAGPEAAWQLAQRGLEVELWEMRPRVSTPAHQTSALGELVCSNSLKSEAPNSAPWLLKQELRRAGSLLLACADAAAVPGGQALAVDRERFSAAIEARLGGHPRIRIRREEATTLPPHAITVLAAGPLCSAPLAEALAQRTGRSHLYFYDAISPIVEAESVDSERAYGGSRYGKGGDDDYLNCPLDRAEYERFYHALVAAASYPLRAFEEPRFFEACLPLEELARRGPDTLRFGPMKPVGLRDPRTGREPYAAVQLRRENLRADSYNLVGFQNHLRFGAQAEVLRLIPALEHARFLRYGQVHRNSYLLAPAVLDGALRLRAQPTIFVAGQLCGTEGYVEAIATGLLAGRFAAAAALGEPAEPPPRASALGSLLHYITRSPIQGYAPANITMDLLPALAIPERERARRHPLQCAAALAAADAWLSTARGFATEAIPA